MKPIDPDRGVYGISVAADLVGIDPQRLRWYETRGLLQPDRTTGGTRRYSQHDLDRLRRIDTLLSDGLNLTGIALVLDLQDQNHHLRQQQGKPRQHEESNPSHGSTTPPT